MEHILFYGIGIGYIFLNPFQVCLQNSISKQIARVTEWLNKEKSSKQTKYFLQIRDQLIQINAAQPGSLQQQALNEEFQSSVNQ